MNIISQLNMTLPIIFINPYFNQDCRLIDKVTELGGVGVIDHVTAGPALFASDTSISRGIRAHLNNLTHAEKASGIKLAIVPMEDCDLFESLEQGSLSKFSFPVLVEVGSIEHVRQAERLRAQGLIVKGTEGGGWVSATHGFVLLQQVLEASRLPVFHQGGVGPCTAAGVIRAGGAGIVLDYHLLLTDESAIDPELKKFFTNLNLPSSTTLNEVSGRVFRAYSRIGTKKIRELKKFEESMATEDFDEYRGILSKTIGHPTATPDIDDSIFPFSEDLVINKSLFKGNHSVSDVIKKFVDAMKIGPSQWPFEEGSALSVEHGVKFPVVQGPMAHVSDNADFLKAVADGGGLPFLALGNMPGPIAQETLEQAREKNGSRFGVGLIGLEVNRSRYEAHLEIMRSNPPKFAILAAGGPELASTIEGIGTCCYLHCPSPGILSEALKAGLKRFVFEGGESGGHIGNLSSLNLWNANLNQLEEAHKNGLDLITVSVLLAGGIGSQRGSAFIAGMTDHLTEKGLKVGLQLGTAYLTTEEAVKAKAITDSYRRLTLESRETVVVGRTVNTMTRVACSEMATKLVERELERLRAGMALRDRKEFYEQDNLGGLRLASKGCAIDPATSQSDCPQFCELSPQEQIERGLYLMGQVACLLDEPTTIAQLHENLIYKGQEIYRETASKLKLLEPAHTTATTQLKPLKQIEAIQTGVNAMSSNEPGEDFEPTQKVELKSDNEPIAVIGIGLRLPGSDSPEKFWRQIVEKRSGIMPTPDERWGSVDLYYDSDPRVPDKTYSKIGGFICDFNFDPLKYRIPPTVAQKMDRTQKMAIACVADALADAGLSPEALKGQRVGTVIGNSMGGEITDLYAERVGLPRTLLRMREAMASVNVDSSISEKIIEDFRGRFLAGLPEITEDSLPGELANVISGRIANVFNLEGPNFTVDAACASSMAAIMNAVSGLRSRTMDCAIAGGVDTSMQPSIFVKFCKVGALSPDGSRPFDVSANGFVMGEGAGVMVMKRLSDALSSGDRIYALILDVGSSSDGRGKGITAPNAAGQERAIRACLENSGVDPATIGLIEAHGTSTAVGDKTELMILDKFFRNAGSPSGSVGIGSVKSQLGHLKAAAGSAGMIKAILSLYHQSLPPTINVTNPNPCIDWDSSPLSLLTEAREWKTSDRSFRRAGVSAFGFGGTNFHIVLQEYNPALRLVPANKPTQLPVVKFVKPDWPKPDKLSLDGTIWAIGGNNPDELISKIRTILDGINPSTFANQAETHRNECQSFNLRFGFAASDIETTTKKLSSILEALQDPAKRGFLGARGVYSSEGKPSRNSPGAAFLFPGQGSQYPYMLRDLCDRFPIVADTFREADEIMKGLGQKEISSLVFPDPAQIPESGASDIIKDTQILQPMILTADTAIFRLLEKMGMRPVACAGHSLGEYAACVASGVFSFRDALEAVAVRGREMARVSIADPGLMMSIPTDARLVEEILAQVDGYVVAANKNSPKQTVISGETAAVKKAGELFRERGLEGLLIPVSAAFHSGVVAPAREPFMKTLEKLRVSSPAIAIISNVTGDYYPVGPGAPSRIRDLLGKQFAAPVEWVKTLRRLHGDGIRVFVECGPKRVMTNLTLDTLPKDSLALPTNHPKKGGIMQLFESLAALIVEGFELDIPAAESPTQSQNVHPIRKRPTLAIVSSVGDTDDRLSKKEANKSKEIPSPLDGLLDTELREIASKMEFKRFLELQGAPIKSLIKSSFTSFVENILPLERTSNLLKTEGMDLKPVVISGMSTGLPTDIRFPFDKANLDDLILGKNFIKKVPETTRREMLDKNVERLFKGPAGEVELQIVDNMSGVIKLAGFFEDHESVVEEFGLERRLVDTMDVTTRLAVAAGLEALKDAGVPLIQQVKTTTTGGELPGAWTLPPDLREETGVIFASAFPGMASLVDEVTKEARARYGAGAKKRLIDFYTGIVQRIEDDRVKESITSWFTEEFDGLSGANSGELYTFNRNFLLRVMSMGHSQLAQLIKAQGPNTHVDAACAGTTQAILLAKDWIRTGQAKRVLVVAADDVAGRQLFPWIGSGFLAMGAATTNANVDEAALPFDDRRHGLILGSAAAAIVLEKEDLVKQRGMEPIASIEAGVVANSGFHGTRLDVDHILTVMEKMISRWEKQSGISRHELAKKMFFMSHETYSPKRGGSSSAEIKALRSTFGESAGIIPIANTKGFTGHTMGVGIEDVVALRCLQKRRLPPIPNLRFPDPEFKDMNLSHGGHCDAEYALRLAAGFGSQIVMSLYKIVSHEENRVTDFTANRKWLKEISGYQDPVVSIQNRTLRMVERVAVEKPATTKIELAPSNEPVLPIAASSSDAVPAIDEIRQTILALLSEKTGYPPAMLDTSLDLEADLGIDTVKQAEFISDVREKFNIPRIEGLKIAEFPTIEHIINFVMERTSASASSQATIEANQASISSDQRARDEAEVGTKILELLSAKTGYPSEMLDSDLDLEADLGIDTVKQAEFITEVRETFGIPRIEGLKIADFPTIKHIIGFVIEKGSQKPSDKVPEKLADPSPTNLSSARINVYEAKLVTVQTRKISTIPAIDEVLVFRGEDSFVTGVREVFGSIPVTRLIDPGEIQARNNSRIGLINIAASSDLDSSLNNSFELFRKLAATFDNGPVFLVNVVSEDGAWGFEAPKDTGYISGAITGAAKSFSREYPETICKCLDIHPEILAKKGPEIVFRSLIEDFPLETGVSSDLKLRSVRFALSTGMTETSNPVSQGEVILVTGGARGITAECLKGIATQVPVTFVILGRTTLSPRSESLSTYGPEEWNQEKLKIVERYKREGKAPTPVSVEKELSRLRNEGEVFINLKKLRNFGSEVIYRGIDIIDLVAVDKTINEIGRLCGRVDVFVHGAGIDISRSLSSKTMDQIRLVFDVKVVGARNILASLERLQLPPRRIIGFGSVAGRFGNIAQIDYSAANDSLAHLLRRMDGDNEVRASIIDWAPWAEVGMATRGSVQQSLEEAGIDFIPPEKGVSAFMQELARSSGSPEILVAGKLGPFEEDAFVTHGEQSEKVFFLAGQKATIESLIPGEHLKMKIELDPSHPLLNDHRIDRAAVFPGAGGIEIMRKAAEILDPSTSKMVIQNVRFMKPLKIFKNEKFEAKVDVFRVSGPVIKFKAHISSSLLDKEGRPFGEPRLHHELSLGSDEPAHIDVPNQNWKQAVFVPELEIYSVFFHGPAFRFLDYVSVEGNGNGVRFRFKDTEHRPDMFPDIIPAAIETAFQAGAAFGLESYGVIPLPVGVEKIVILKPNGTPTHGVVIPTNIISKPGTDVRTKIRFDGILSEADGTRVILLKGFEMVELKTVNSFPNRIFEEMSPVDELPDELEKDSESAKLFVDDDSTSYLANATPKRRKEWIAGRIIMRRALTRLLSNNGNAQYKDKLVRILSDDLGKPTVSFSDDSDVEFAAVTVSHSNGLVMGSAVATKAFQGIGIDIEKVEKRSRGWGSDYFSDSEIELANGSEDRARQLTRIWSLKEASLKALGVGLRYDLRDINVVSLEKCGRARLEFQNEAGNFLRDNGFQSIEARVEDVGDVVVARALIRR
ncbi:MAG: SDR family NAD(P)-dependent oxidoreductase [Desulfomonilaceae bacterium]